MPKRIDKYRIILASPSDLRDERESMDDVIAELNNTYGSRNDLILELIKWETHSAPGIIDSCPQDLIDVDFGDDYDLFIGVLWKMFGTPTMDYGSGTEQEFRNAFLKYKKEPNKLQILFYFKTASPSSLADIKPSELLKVNEFKTEIGEKGVYYWEFNTTEELHKFLRIHIPKRIDELRLKNKQETSSDTKAELVVYQSDYKEELGVIDLEEIYEESFEDSTMALSRISEATNWIGLEIDKKTEEITSLSSKKQDLGKKVLRDFYLRTAAIMNDYASRISPDIPIFISSFEKGSDSLSNLVSIYKSDFNETRDEDIQETLKSIEELSTGISEGLSSMKLFLQSVSNLPRMSKELNQARRNVESTLEYLINTLEVSYSISIELYKELNGE